MGIGNGWNEVEYIALNQDFHRRGRRIEEQVTLLRQLWTEPLVTFKGHWHTIPDAGLNPLPVQRPIPIWFGGHADALLRRIARMGDGWMPTYRQPADAKSSLDKLDAYLAEQGRSRADIGLEARISYGQGDRAVWDSLITDWRDLGATHLSVNTMRLGLASPQAHLNALRAFAQAVLPA
jgi:alkanesulfonate monooxygenase SsuD/methylene tetrahydromethanopterin reductase-like flavin-dependent oxidoreductase (luciferase family)